MPEHLVRQFLTERIADWQDAVITPVEEGQTALSFRLRLDGRAAFLKLDTEPRPPFVNSRREEAELQSIAAEQNLAPRVLFADEDCLLTEYVGGTALSPHDLLSADTIATIGHRLRQLHGLPTCGRRFDAVIAAQRYAAAIGDSHTVERCVAAVEALPDDEAPVLSHNDLVAGNLLKSDRLLFIDWEYACDNTPLFDVATLIAHHGLLHEQIESLLAARFGVFDESRRPSLEATIDAYHALHWLWLASREPDSPELVSIAERVPG